MTLQTNYQRLQDNLAYSISKTKTMHVTPR